MMQQLTGVAAILHCAGPFSVTSRPLLDACLRTGTHYLVSTQFGDLLQGLRLPPYWREMIREKMLEAAKQTGVDTESVEREKERLKLKRGRVLKQHREGYIDDEEFEGEMAAVELALHALEVRSWTGSAWMR